MKKTTKLATLCKLWEADEKTEREFFEILSFLVPEEKEKTMLQAQNVPKENIADLRADVAEKSLEKSQVLAIAPKHEKGYIAIPRALEEV